MNQNKLQSLWPIKSVKKNMAYETVFIVKFAIQQENVKRLQDNEINDNIKKSFK